MELLHCIVYIGNLYLQTGHKMHLAGFMTDSTYRLLLFVDLGLNRHIYVHQLWNKNKWLILYKGYFPNFECFISLMTQMIMVN